MIPKRFTLSTAGAALTAGALSLAGTMANADQQILDDLIVDGSACIGQDCVNGESFGFDTLRLKENNLRIKAQDTSTTASFPSVDWQITFNESSNGGQNKFSIDQITDSARTPFTIEANAPTNSLYVDDGGRIGFSTGTPVVDLHVVSGNTPTLRLDQDGSSGFASQTWDLAGNETNLFFRDATNGSDLPFRIFPDAGSDALTIETGGDIGMGTTSPASSLEIQRAGPANISLDNQTSGSRWIMNSAGSGNFILSEAGTTGIRMAVQTDGNISIGGTCITFDVDEALNDFHCTFASGAAPVCAADPCP